MKISVWCCISCIFPCGAFDVIRIVHTNGHVEEFSRVVRVEDVLKANPKHVLRKSSISSSTDGKIVCKSVTLDPDTELQRGKVYFLQPVICPTEKRRKSSSAERRKKRELEKKKNHESEKESLISDRYLSDILSEKFSFKKDNQRGRVALWRPHLETIPEIASDLHQITVP